MLDIIKRTKKDCKKKKKKKRHMKGIKIFLMEKKLKGTYMVMSNVNIFLRIKGKC